MFCIFKVPYIYIKTADRLCLITSDNLIMLCWAKPLTVIKAVRLQTKNLKRWAFICSSANVSSWCCWEDCSRAVGLGHWMLCFGWVQILWTGPSTVLEMPSADPCLDYYVSMTWKSKICFWMFEMTWLLWNL